MQTINVRRIARVIGLLTDQISDEDPFHARRVAVMAWRIGRRMGLGESDLDDLLLAALVHDCGIASPSEHTTIITQSRWDAEDDHCVSGARYLEGCPHLDRFCTIVRYHHTPWTVLIDTDIAERDKLLANILFCADRCYVGFYRLCLHHGADYIINHKAELIAQVDTLGVETLSPDILSAYRGVARTDGFWLALYPDFLDSSLSPINRNDGLNVTVTYGQMRTIAILISRLVDAKSHFTHEHSERVALLASRFGQIIGIAPDTSGPFEIAALLHDVGKQQAPENLLLKPGALDERERAVIKRHTIGSEITLSQLFPDSKIVTWAASHHEKLDGSGYPYGLNAEDLDIHSRILTVADIFQALTQDRPYRGPITMETALEMIIDMVKIGELDHDVVHVLGANVQEFYQLSTQ